MHIPILSFLLLTSTLANASLQVLKRQGSTIPCSQQGMKDCGDACIDLTDTCCPDKAGGCSVGTYCSLGSNGEYGCCRIGRTCTGPGGVNSQITFLTSTPALPRPVTPLTTRTSALVGPSVLPSLTRSSVAALSVPVIEESSTKPATTATTTTSQARTGGGNPTTTGQPAAATGGAGAGVQGLVLVGSLAFILLGIAA